MGPSTCLAKQKLRAQGTSAIAPLNPDDTLAQLLPHPQGIHRLPPIGADVDGRSFLPEGVGSLKHGDWYADLRLGTCLAMLQTADNFIESISLNVFPLMLQCSCYPSRRPTL